MEEKLSRTTALTGLSDMEGKSGDSRSRPIEQETQLALQWLVESLPFMLRDTGTTELGYMLLVLSPSVIQATRQGGIPITTWEIPIKQSRSSK